MKVNIAECHPYFLHQLAPCEGHLAAEALKVNGFALADTLAVCHLQHPPDAISNAVPPVAAVLNQQLSQGGFTRALWPD
jgi:hypothetical protein